MPGSGRLALLRPGESTGVAVVLAGAGATLVLVLVLVLAAGVRGHRIAARVNREQQWGPPNTR